MDGYNAWLLMAYHKSKHWANFGAQALAPYHKEKFAYDAERLFYKWQRGRQ